ncbi:cysteine--tRNA ligase [bacterium]|nr:cysteine--tRNA ligase [bacterium]MBU1637556.1 cysteine--tRNA ligase [bacterium]
MTSLRLYNTLTRHLDEFVPGEPGKVKMYTCGPTVYARAHIGNFRTFMFSDLLRRYLAYKGYDVFWVMNITDIDDKTIKGAHAEGIPLRDYTSRYAEAFFNDCKTLNITPADLYPRATEHIEDMVHLVEELKTKGIAYEAEGSYYYKIGAFPAYGKFARLNMKEMMVGERVASDEYEKEDIRDFALWKGYEAEDGDVFWETSIGKGRPGWHIECSAMSLRYLGEDFDIHLGGVDLIFPHHQNEIAQTEGATGKRLARYWVHSEHLLIDGGKMSKSLNNFYTLDDLLEKGWKPREIRFALLAGHYRQRTNFSINSLEAVRASLARLDSCVRNQELATGSGAGQEVKDIIALRETEFQMAMDDDLNYPEALAAVFNLVRDLNKTCADGGIGPEERAIAMAALRRFDSVLGFLFSDEMETCVVCDDIEINSLVRQRDEARAAKNWAEADRIRDSLAEQGIVLEDRPGGMTVWRRK